MKINELPLKEISIFEIYNGAIATYEVPIYQRNYAWEKDEISTLIQDVFDAQLSGKTTYFIGTLVSHHKGDGVYEVIDGQQRLTTINLVLHALGIIPQNKLSYRARKKSNDSIQSIPHFKVEDLDQGIVNGYKYAKTSIEEIVPNNDLPMFKKYFMDGVHLIHYQVPKDIDLNHYFEIMNSRGEQLEKHEIIKARLIQALGSQGDKAKFNRLWEFCSEMNVYIQQKYADQRIFGPDYGKFILQSFDDLPHVDSQSNNFTIAELISKINTSGEPKSEDTLDSFQAIMDFSNFLLVVLKLIRTEEKDFDLTRFNLDDKELIREFDQINIDEAFAKKFGYHLLKAKYLLDNYMVHHSNDEDTMDHNPWKLQFWQKDAKHAYLKNLEGDSDLHTKLVHLLSMFEVSFGARQRKNYLFYCLFYLFRTGDRSLKMYLDFVTWLAQKYLKSVYLNKNNLNDINTPKPGSFDNSVMTRDSNLGHYTLNTETPDLPSDFNAVYGDGTTPCRGLPLFVFNLLDYKIWLKYADELRGEQKDSLDQRISFFEQLGCSDLKRNVFDQFYFSRTRRSLEHYFPQANATGQNGLPDQNQINCFGNYAMIGSEANSSGSNWSPRAKREHYLDASGKIKQVSVASLKFMIMMQTCKENSSKSGQEWVYADIKTHQIQMLRLLVG